MATAEPSYEEGTRVVSLTGQATPTGSHDPEQLLGVLLKTPGGAVIYDHLRQLLGEWRVVRSASRWRAVQGAVSHGYAALLALLLHELTRDASDENIVRICARLAEIRSAFPDWLGGVAGAGVPPRHSYDDTRALYAVLQDSLDRLTRAREAPPPAPSQPAPPPAAMQPPPQSPPGEITGEGPRADAALREHLERTRDELDKMQKTLSHKVHEAIEQNARFGDLLHVVRSLLQQAGSVEELATLKEMLIGSMSELLQGQRLLAENLQSTSQYLHLAAADCTRLCDELNSVRKLSLTDEFTGLPNRRAFMRRAEEEAGRARRYGTPLALAIIDLDKFKDINDTYGHAAGDAVLRCYAERVLTSFRHYDMVARYGGDEFSVLLPSTGKAGALDALRKVRSRAANTRCEFGGALRPVPTFSAGLTLYVPGESIESLLRRADRVLYRAKQSGRNCIEVEIPPVLETQEAEGTNG